MMKDFRISRKTKGQPILKNGWRTVNQQNTVRLEPKKKVKNEQHTPAGR